MGWPLRSDIKWICDKCKLIVEYDKAVFPDPNKTECYHEECYTIDIFCCQNCNFATDDWNQISEHLETGHWISKVTKEGG